MFGFLAKHLSDEPPQEERKGPLLTVKPTVVNTTPIVLEKTQPTVIEKTEKIVINDSEPQVLDADSPEIGKKASGKSEFEEQKI